MSVDGSVHARLARQARNESLLREVNERVETLADDAAGLELFGFHCECGVEPFCGAFVSMTREEYDAVRSQDDRFAVAPGHETAGLERVVARSDRYLVVDKVDEFEPLVADDPRGKSSA